jgi:hypothetical protein
MGVLMSSATIDILAVCWKLEVFLMFEERWGTNGNG